MQDKVTTAWFRKAKQNNRKLALLTAYDYVAAKIIDNAGIDGILVGDSLGMVVLGYEDTTRVTMNDMLHHIKAVVRGTKRALVIGDMPFLSIHLGKYKTVKNAGKLVREGGCKAVKLEGGEEIIEDVKAIINAGIPVMGHLGYTPQSVNVFGGHKAQGKTLDHAKKILNDAVLLEKAGVFSIVLECVPYKLAELISNSISIPAIGIGSGAGCDGQVQLAPDILGMLKDFSPKHVKKYANLDQTIDETVKKYINEVRESVFPKESNSFIIDDEIINTLKTGLPLEQEVV
ncbi:3-methyl-2-oxobutanoate hydroxymethyltransferase [bacterium]